MKRSEITDEHVIELAAAWEHDFHAPGVVKALTEEGIPEKVAMAKVLHLVDRGLLTYGASPYYAWPTP